MEGAGGQLSTLRAGGSGEGAGGQPSTLRAGRSGGGGREGSQAHSEPGGVVEWGGRAAKHTQSWEEWWRGAGMPSKHTQSRGKWWRAAGGQPSTLRAGGNGGGGREGSQAHSEPKGVVEGG